MLANSERKIVEAQIWLADEAREETSALADWLASEDELRGHIRAGRSAIRETDLGSFTDVLTVILGTGGAGTVLVSSLKTWLQTRRTKAKITVKVGDRSVSLDIETVDKVEPLLAEILKVRDEG